jgi:hypothetical protein
MKPSLRSAPASRQRGQALTEFLVAAVAIVPLFLLIPLVAKYQDISNSTQLASRYVAFEATVRNDSVNTWKPEIQLQQEVARRFFSNADAPIKTADAAGNFKAHQNLFWRDPIDSPLIRDLGTDVRLSFGPGNSAAHAGAFTGASDGTPFPLHTQLGLPARGIYTANVAVDVANLPTGLRFFQPFDTINLSMRRSTSVVIDAWTAKDPAQVESRIAGSPAIFPSASLASVSPAVDAAVTLIDLPGGLSGPRLGRLDFWRDVVPEDRLRSRN